MTDGSAPSDPWPGTGRRRAPHNPRARWLAASAVAALATVLGLSLALRSGAAACAAPPARAAAAVPVGGAPTAPPVGGTVHKGKATFYDSQGGGGNCSFTGPPADHLYVALGPAEYSTGAACGGHLDVTGPKGTVRVVVMDQCPECAAGHLDLSAEAFAKIADPVQGVVAVTYRGVVDPPLPGPLTFRIKEGSSQWWFAVRVGQHGNPLRSVEVRQGSSGAWRAAQRQDHNYWLIASGAGSGPYSVRITDVYGHRATTSGIRMAPGEVQRSSVRMYGGGTAAASSVTPRRTPSARPSPPARALVTSPAVTPSVVSDAVAASPPRVEETRPADCRG